MSLNREVTEATLALFDASERGDAKAVAELVKTADLNWHRTQSVRSTPASSHSLHELLAIEIED